MPLVRFTEVLNERFGGTYRTKVYSVRMVGVEMDLTEVEVSRLNRSHPGLIEPVKPGEAQADAERATEAAGDDDDEEADADNPKKEIRGGHDKEIRGGTIKGRKPRKPRKRGKR